MISDESALLIKSLMEDNLRLRNLLYAWMTATNNDYSTVMRMQLIRDTNDALKK